MIADIRRWLQEEEVKTKDFEDQYADLHLLVFSANGRRYIDIVILKKHQDSIIFVGRLELSPEDRTYYSKLKASGKNAFKLGLLETLLYFDVTFKPEPNYDELQHIEIRKKMYFEAIKKQSFFDAINAVFRAGDAVNMNYSKYLSKGAGPEPSA